ncbi:MAG: DUF6776 family protein [Pseudomonadota bacterium]
MTGWEVRPRNAGNQRWQRGLIVVLLLALPLAFWGGLLWGERDTQAALAEQQTLRAHLDQQARQVAVLQLRLAQVGSGDKVGQQADEQNRLTIKLLEEQIFALQQDLSAYKGVLAPDSRRDGLRIRAFEVQGTDRPRHFRYKLLLSRVGPDDQSLTGQLTVTLEGLQDGKAVSLPLASLSPELAAQTIPFAFKHFQAIPEAARFADLELPAGFEPQQIEVRAEVQGHKPLVRTFKWNDKK